MLLKRTVFAILIVLAVAGAVLSIYRVQPMPSALVNSWAAMIWGLLLLLLWAWVRSEKKALLADLPVWSWLLILMWLLIQTRLLNPPYADAFLFPVAALLFCWALHVVASNVTEQQRNWLSQCLGWAFLISSFGTALLQTIQLTQAPILVGYVMPLPDGMQPFGNLAQRNQAAFVHVLGMLALVHLWSDHFSGAMILRRFGMLLLMPMIWGLAMTSSRLFLFLGGIVWVASIWQLAALNFGVSVAFKGAWWIRVVSLSVMLILVYALMYFGFTAVMPWIAPEVVFDNVVERLGNVSNETRVVLQQQAWAMFLQNPLTGMGWGSFSAFALHWSDRSALPMYAKHSHFLPTHWLAELGLIGVVAALPLAWLVWKIIANKNLWRRNFFLQGFVLATLVYSCSEYPLWEAFFLLPFAFVLGLQHGALQREVSNGGKIISSSWVLLVGMVMILGSAWSARTYLHFHFVGQKVFAGKKEDAAVFGEIASISWSFGYLTLKDVYLFVIIPLDDDDIDEKIKLGERVAGRFIDANVLQRLGFLYAIKGDYEKSKRMMQDACRFYPERCEEVMGNMLKVPEEHQEKFKLMHAELTQWWSNHPRNPALPPG